MHCWKAAQTNKNILDYFLILQKNDKNTFYILQDVNEPVFFSPLFLSGVLWAPPSNRFLGPTLYTSRLDL